MVDNVGHTLRAKMTANLTVPYEQPEWNSKPAWKLPGWAEPVVSCPPVTFFCFFFFLYISPLALPSFPPSPSNPCLPEPQMVASILVGSMIITRRKGYRILDNTTRQYGLLSGEPDSTRSSNDLSRDYPLDDDLSDDMTTMKHPPKKRRVCCTTIYTPNSSRFAGNIHSRILQRFPFLIEMFYWIITYAFYRCTSLLSQAIFSETGIWDVAQDHGLAVLEFEQFSWLSFLWPVPELKVQQWFMHGHQTFLTVLNRSYALIHIPGTVGYVPPPMVTYPDLC